MSINQCKRCDEIFKLPYKTKICDDCKLPMHCKDNVLKIIFFENKSTKWLKRYYKEVIRRQKSYRSAETEGFVTDELLKRGIKI
jgi:hypothetical protein